MFTTIAINEDTNNVLLEIIPLYKKKHELKKLSRSKIILEALKILKQMEQL